MRANLTMRHRQYQGYEDFRPPYFAAIFKAAGRRQFARRKRLFR
jgi:hypothetical protein|tara:strand:- start:695 stop:826 length:132 start_codon:yes stop_codon:yes gene_type:complete